MGRLLRLSRWWPLLAALIVGPLLLAGCAGMSLRQPSLPSDMYDQPSFRRQEAPLPVPAAAVPVSGRPQTFTEQQATALSNPFAGQLEAVAAGQRLFAINCQMCHGTEGKGNGAIASYFPPKPTDLTSERVRGLSDGQIFWTITNGFARMPDFRNKLGVEERWQIVAFVRSLPTP